ncbi:hypothetical protein RFI_32770 [Reticulomyxa filosa]|uniref:Uncharacterized protein n=1 Tax=Reticulomyxa filosa TaxID=46433 RepID=X6LV71_RETFI|nr:hypothetical protein RFI_32770 [Reticulomyxa filosa]|eukprot:ETO04625.1 hypothetical protein RFI_32770 [Reticulomyxa filosa]
MFDDERQAKHMIYRKKWYQATSMKRCSRFNKIHYGHENKSDRNNHFTVREKRGYKIRDDTYMEQHDNINLTSQSGVAATTRKQMAKDKKQGSEFVYYFVLKLQFLFKYLDIELSDC